MTQMFAFIPARAGSKGLPGKNTRNMAGKPLFMHAVQLAHDCGIPEVFVSTDISEIIDNPSDLYRVDRRPPALCTDEAKMADVILEFLRRQELDHGRIILLQPTSPLRRATDVERCLNVANDKRYDMIMTIREDDPTIRKMGDLIGDTFVPFDRQSVFSNRQALRPTYKPNGAIYVIDIQAMLSAGGFPSERIGAVVMDSETSIDVDNIDDFRKCEQIMNERHSHAHR